ncbi:signal peptidase I [Pseudoflavonifractor phocaeensis]|uniref:signal peptidase I n=1 Tax=Pseudoflavonifractor phocaeensis TaxID=1870988 RepID=UPI00308414BF
MTAQSQTSTPQKESLTSVQGLSMDLFFWLQALTVCLTVLILLFTFAGRVVGVKGNSMYPTLHNGDTLLLQSVGYTPRQGDLVVLNKEFGTFDEPIVKRIIALGGQTVSIDYQAGTVSVDGQVLDEPYIAEAMEEPGDIYLTIRELTVPEGSVFVMGDNRNHSSDSRDERLGAVDERYIIGKAIMVCFPFSDFRLLV